MPDYQPSPSDAPNAASQFGRRLIVTILGIESLLCFALIVWPALLRIVAHEFGAEIAPDEGLVRFLAVGLFIGLTIARFIISAQAGPSPTAIAWTEVATQTGGTFTQQPRSLTKSGWEGGPAVNWTVQGVPVMLKSIVQTRNNTAMARLQCQVRLSQPFQFTICPRTFMNRTLSSPKMWGVLLTVSKNATVSGESSEERRRAMEQMSFLATPDKPIGDPLFDEAFMMKSGDETAARDFFSDAGVGHWLHELTGRTKGWNLSLLAADSSGGYHITLDLAGSERDQEALRAAYSTMDAAIGRLRARGMMARDKSAA